MSLENLEIFESAWRPADFINEEGVESRLRDGLLVSDCPKCGKELWALPSGFLCANRLCSFRAGSVLDYLLLRLRLPSYLEGVKFMWKHRRAHLDFFNTALESDIIASLAETANNRRHVFEFFLRQVLIPPPANAPLSAASEWLRSCGIGIASNSMSAVPVSDTQVQELLVKLGPFGSTSGLPSGGGVLFPFYGNHHTVAEIIFWSTKAKNFSKLSAAPFKFSFNGLLEGLPGDAVVLCSNKIDAAVLNTSYAEAAVGKVAASLFHNRHGTLKEINLTTPCFLYAPAEPLGPAGAYAQVCPTLRVKPHDLHHTTGAPQQSWEAFMIKELVARITSEGFSDSARTLLDSAKLGAGARDRVFWALQQQGLLEAMDRLEEHLQQTPVYCENNYSLFATAGGYSTVKGDGDRRSVTNFTLELHKNLIFAGSTDKFITGAVLFRGRTCPIMLDSRHLDQSKEFEAVIRGAEARVARVDESEVLPAVIDKKALTIVLGHLRASAAGLPRAQGLACLGWNLKKDQFNAPSWVSTASELIDMHFIFHPDADVLRYFSTEPPEEIPQPPNLPQGICGMIAQLAAMAARAYMELPVRPIAIQDTPMARALLQSMFAGMGQKDIYKLNFNSRYAEEVRHLIGFPILAQGYSSSQIERSHLPAFILSEKGAAISGSVKGAELLYASTALRRALQSVTQWMLRTGGKQFVRQQSVSNDVELLREGHWLLQEVCKFRTWEAAPVQYQMLEKLLQNIPAESVGSFFSHHLEDQKVYFQISTFKSIVDMTTLELELRARCEFFESNKEFFVMDALTATQILNNFYENKAFPSPITAPLSCPSGPGEPIIPRVGSL